MYFLMFLPNCNFKILLDFVKHLDLTELHVSVE